MSRFYDAAFYWSVGSFVKFEVHNEGIVKASVGSMLSAMSAGLMSVGMSSGADSFGLSSMSSFSAMISILLTGWPSLVVNLFTVRWPFMYIFLPFFRCVIKCSGYHTCWGGYLWWLVKYSSRALVVIFVMVSFSFLCLAT